MNDLVEIKEYLKEMRKRTEEAEKSTRRLKENYQETVLKVITRMEIDYDNISDQFLYTQQLIEFFHDIMSLVHYTDYISIALDEIGYHLKKLEAREKCRSVPIVENIIRRATTIDT